MEASSRATPLPMPRLGAGAPGGAGSGAAALPMPRLAPVTSATLPSRPRSISGLDRGQAGRAGDRAPAEIRGDFLAPGGEWVTGTQLKEAIDPGGHQCLDARGPAHRRGQLRAQRVGDLGGFGAEAAVD